MNTLLDDFEYHFNHYFKPIIIIKNNIHILEYTIDKFKFDLILEKIDSSHFNITFKVEENYETDLEIIKRIYTKDINIIKYYLYKYYYLSNINI